MDLDRLDTLARSIASAGSRRSLLGLLATAPVVAGLLTTFDHADTEAKAQRRRRRQRGEGPGSRKGHKRKNKDKGKRKPACKPEATATTCAGRCGPVQNNCKKLVDCGPCSCDPPCDPCQRCTSERTCQPCEACCHDVCCAGDNAICHADSGECCVPGADAQTCAEQCGEVFNNCGVIVDCGACPEDPLGAACAALRADDLYVYEPGADCGGDQVCDCGQIIYYPNGRVVQCKRPGVCRPNHAPVALDVDLKHPWKMTPVPIELNGYEPDFEEFLTYRIVTFPQHGLLSTLYNGIFVGEPGDAALPVPPLPADTPMDCYPRCLGGSSPGCSVTNPCPHCNGVTCPEGIYFRDWVDYIPFSTTWTGTDSFTYAAVDLFGSEGPPALVTLTIFDDGSDF